MFALLHPPRAAGVNLFVHLHKLVVQVLPLRFLDALVNGLTSRVSSLRSRAVVTIHRPPHRRC